MGLEDSAMVDEAVDDGDRELHRWGGCGGGLGDIIQDSLCSSLQNSEHAQRAFSKAGQLRTSLIIMASVSND
jgi:hypothetical protein